MMENPLPTISSQRALYVLTRIRPNDGWSIQQEPQQQQLKQGSIAMRLCRRGVPVTDTYFVDIHYDPVQKLVMGVLTKDGEQCQIIVDRNGQLIRDVQITNCKNYKYIPNPDNDPTTSRPSVSSSSAAAAGTSAAAATPSPPAFFELTPQDKQQMEQYIKYALIGLAALIILKVLASTGLLIILLPAIYIYGLLTCPSPNTFDAKQQLKRVLRGCHLPDSHPDKPNKSMIESWTARITASITTELATLPGYTVQIDPILGGFIQYVQVHVPTINLQCTWIGTNHTWYYIGSKQITTEGE